ncbi:hypothetical protein [Streptomyces lydicus]|uniref:hypothetical protein n=1 Tax=Streptomyces lydicus TaxID=47763 RepID=UPI0037CF51A0
MPVVTASLALGTYRLREVAAAARRAAACPETAWVDTAPNYLAGRAHACSLPSSPTIQGCRSRQRSASSHLARPPL